VSLCRRRGGNVSQVTDEDYRSLSGPSRCLPKLMIRTACFHFTTLRRPLYKVHDVNTRRPRGERMLTKFGIAVEHQKLSCKFNLARIGPVSIFNST
jgi:hypothetical protein